MKAACEELFLKSIQSDFNRQLILIESDKIG